MNRSDSFNKTSSAVGSTSWMEKELERAQQQVMQDVEEFSYAALRELEWMNEHIRELTENSDSNLANLLKTPGRLKGALSPRKMMMSAQRSAVKLNGGHVHFDQSPTRIRTSPYRVAKSPSPKKMPIRALQTPIDLKPPASQQRQKQMQSQPQSPSVKTAQQQKEEEDGDDEASFMAIRKSISLNKASNTNTNSNTVRTPAPKPTTAPASSPVIAASAATASKSDRPEKEVDMDKDSQNDDFYDEKPDTHKILAASTPAPAVGGSSLLRGDHTQTSSIFESDSESEDGETPVVNKSSFGFTGLPKKAPVIKRSLAKTPSTSVSSSRTESTMVSRLHKDPSSFESKMAASASYSASTNPTDSSSVDKNRRGTTEDEKDENNEDRNNDREIAPESRVSVHYPRLEPTTSAGTTSSTTTSTAPVTVTAANVFTPHNDHRNDDFDFELSPPSGYKEKIPKPANLRSSPMRQQQSQQSQTSHKPQTSNVDDDDLIPKGNSISNSNSARQVSASSSIRSASSSIRSKLSPSKSPNKGDTSASGGGYLSQLASGVFRSARNIFSKDSPPKGSNPGSPVRETSPKKDKDAEAPKSSVKRTDTISRLMAPTFASSTRNARAMSPSRANQSPLAEKKGIYPDMSKIAPASAIKKNQLLSTPSSPSKEMATRSHTVNAVKNGLANKELGTSASSKATTSATSTTAAAAAKTASAPAPAPVSSSAENDNTSDRTAATKRASNAPEAKSYNSSKLTKQTLQAKKTATQASKPVHVKVPTAANREAEKKVAAASSASSAPSASSRLSTNSSLSNTSLPVKARVLKNQDSKATLKAVPSKQEEMPKLRRNIQLEAEAARQQQQKTKKNEMASATNSVNRKRTSEQASLVGSPLEKKATRVSQLAKYKKPQAGGSLMKSTVVHQAKTVNMPQVDGVKFSNEQIRFAPSSNGKHAQQQQQQHQPPHVQSQPHSQPQQPQSQPQPQQPQQPQSSTKIHIPANPFRQLPTVSNVSTPAPAHKTNGDNIVLPDIMSESEDDDDGSVLQDWANSPELRNMLLRQQQVNPDSVFGPIAPLHMDEIFKNSTRLSRFRPRSSSANWNNNDRLTPEEMEQYANQMGYNK